jgi:hypothetical protein
MSPPPLPEDDKHDDIARLLELGVITDWWFNEEGEVQYNVNISKLEQITGVTIPT